MTLGVLIKAQGALGLLGFCGLSGCSHPASITFSSDYQVPLFLSGPLVPGPEPQRFHSSLADESIFVLLREPVGRGWSRWFGCAVLLKPFTARPTLLPPHPGLIL